MQIVLSLALIVLLGLGAFAPAFVAARESLALLAIYLAAPLAHSFRLKSAGVAFIAENGGGPACAYATPYRRSTSNNF